MYLPLCAPVSTRTHTGAHAQAHSLYPVKSNRHCVFRSEAFADILLSLCCAPDDDLRAEAAKVVSEQLCEAHVAKHVRDFVEALLRSLALPPRAPVTAGAGTESASAEESEPTLAGEGFACDIVIFHSDFVDCECVRIRLCVLTFSYVIAIHYASQYYSEARVLRFRSHSYALSDLLDLY